jgi:hypothetical protein
MMTTTGHATRHRGHSDAGHGLEAVEALQHRPELAALDEAQLQLALEAEGAHRGTREILQQHGQPRERQRHHQHGVGTNRYGIMNDHVQ